jgi:hypothetical protein
LPILLQYYNFVFLCHYSDSLLSQKYPSLWWDGLYVLIILEAVASILCKEQ